MNQSVSQSVRLSQPTSVVGNALQLRGFTDDILGRAVAGVELLDEGWRKVWVVVDKALE